MTTYDLDDGCLFPWRAVLARYVIFCQGVSSRSEPHLGWICLVFLALALCLYDVRRVWLSDVSTDEGTGPRAVHVALSVLSGLSRHTPPLVCIMHTSVLGDAAVVYDSA